MMSCIGIHTKHQPKLIKLLDILGYKYEKDSKYENLFYSDCPLSKLQSLRDYIENI